MAEVHGAIGEARASLRAKRLLAGRGTYVADIKRPRMVHLAFLRSPHAHAAIEGIDCGGARDHPGVVAVFTAADLAGVCTPWRGAHGLFPELKAPEQHPLATTRVRFVGEPVAAVVATSRAAAEDAAEQILVDYRALPAVADPEEAARADSALVHEEFGSNVAFAAEVSAGDPARAFADADAVVEATLRFARHTGVPLETRGLIAEFEPSEGQLTVHISHQCPYQMQDIFARHLGLAEHRVRVVCPDVGGAFGIKQQAYGDEMAVCAAAMLLGRPVAWFADRLESFAADIHAREHVVHARMAVSRDGGIRAIEARDLFAIGPYSQYPRSSIGEGRALLSLIGAPYAFENLDVSTRVVFQNKGMVGHYRGVGHPIACAVTERLVDLAAHRLGLDPAEMRRRNFVADEAMPHRAPTGVTYRRLGFGRCLANLDAAVDLAQMRRRCESERAEGRLVGLGLAAFVEMTTRGPHFYGDGGVRVSARDAASVSLEPSGVVRVISSVTEQGQGVETGVAQVVAAALDLPLDDVAIVTGDSAVCHHGGGTWASRSMAVGGEAAWRAARALRAEILAIAGPLLQLPAEALDLKGRQIVSRQDGLPRLALADLAALAHFRPHALPDGRMPQLVHSASFGPDAPFRPGCGIQLSLVEIDPDTGIVTLRRHVVAHDCGRVVNPLLVEEQIRGGVVQGIGAALFEETLYDADGQLLNASLADYLVPMAAEMPDIEIVHVDAPAAAGEDLDLAGVGEAGTAGASGAVLNAINDALLSRGASLNRIPATPERVLDALGAFTPLPAGAR